MQVSLSWLTGFTIDCCITDIFKTKAENTTYTHVASMAATYDVAVTVMAASLLSLHSNILMLLYKSLKI